MLRAFWGTCMLAIARQPLEHRCKRFLSVMSAADAWQAIEAGLSLLDILLSTVANDFFQYWVGLDLGLLIEASWLSQLSLCLPAQGTSNQKWRLLGAAMTVKRWMNDSFRRTQRGSKPFSRSVCTYVFDTNKCSRHCFVHVWMPTFMTAKRTDDIAIAHIRRNVHRWYQVLCKISSAHDLILPIEFCQIRAAWISCLLFDSILIWLHCKAFEIFCIKQRIYAACRNIIKVSSAFTDFVFSKFSSKEKVKAVTVCCTTLCDGYVSGCAQRAVMNFSVLVIFMTEIRFILRYGWKQVCCTFSCSWCTFSNPTRLECERWCDALYRWNLACVWMYLT